MTDKEAAATPAPPAPAAPNAEGVDPHAATLTPEAEAYRKALEDDWTTWVAAADIPYGNVLAYAKGAPVPASNVARWRYDDQGLVEKRTSKAGQALLEEAGPRTPATVKAPGD